MQARWRKCLEYEGLAMSKRRLWIVPVAAFFVLIAYACNDGGEVAVQDIVEPVATPGVIS